MNERIEKLIMESVNFRLDPDSNAYEAQVCPEDLEYLVELIVGECMRMCDVAAIGYDSHGHIKEGNGCATAREYIKEHFGVE